MSLTLSFCKGGPRYCRCETVPKFAVRVIDSAAEKLERRHVSAGLLHRRSVTTFIVLSEPLRTEKSLDLAAIVMKMKYILDLRELQNEVNGVLAKAQEFTADPRTDSKLGKLLFVESDIVLYSNLARVLASDILTYYHF